MDADLPPELERRKAKFNAQQEDIRKREGAGDTAAAQAITHKYIQEFAAAIERALAERSSPAHRQFLTVIRDPKLAPEALALCILRGAQHGIGQRHNCRDTMLRIGGLIADECWGKQLTEDQSLLAEDVERRSRQLAPDAERRKKIARTLAAR
jgi:hypothetical protein